MKIITKNFYLYEDIKLKKYFEVVKTGNYFLLTKVKIATLLECAQAWESIIERNGKETGNNDYENYRDLESSFGMLIADYNIVTGLIAKLWIREDKKIVGELRSLGYKFNYRTTKEYIANLEEAFHRSKSILTRIQMNRNEIADLIVEPDEKPSMEKELARLSAQLKFTIKNNITLVRYNELQKYVRERILEKQIDEE